MIHARRRPSDIATLVAGVALFRDLDMRCRHGQSVLASIGRVVTARALSDRQDMAHLGWFKSTEVLVTIGALLVTGRDMPGRQALGRCPVMAGRALAISRCIMSVSNSRPA